MLTLAQINFAFNPASIIGSFYVLFSIIYFIFMIVWVRRGASRLNDTSIGLYIIQTIFAPFLMLIPGVILVFQGWRLDPVLQLAEFLLFILIIYLSVKDIVINAIKKSRRFDN